jgi:hypothetical protein
MSDEEFKKTVFVYLLGARRGLSRRPLLIVHSEPFNLEGQWGVFIVLANDISDSLLK